jgi:hypothetical protein
LCSAPWVTPSMCLGIEPAGSIKMRVYVALDGGTLPHFNQSGITENRFGSLI